ncbi:plasmalemma vesicle-associated protein-like [Carassius carassius]|uniref:plasmalemma vesicle-associated protein-like n=1 Tax=Carassius carassius TaxID=217509 RepID=UPI002868C2BD|nr:plasmalemma vesicle-associated protein-like [Carassius carassius]
MYNNSYSRATLGLETKHIHKAKKGKSCGYYMRILFFFSSLIQSLIIASLVLFLVYGQPEKTAEEKRVEELELAFNKLSTDNTKLRKDKADLTSALKAKTGEKDAADKEIAKLKNDLNLTTIKSSNVQKSLSLCEASKIKLLSTRNTPLPCPPSNNNQNGEIKSLNSLLEQQKVLYGILKNNFSQTVEYLKADLDNAVKDKNEHHSLVIQLRQENLSLKSQLDVYTKKCKEDFAVSLQGIQTVTSAFLTKIDNFFTNSVTFHLTCPKQEEQMERIRSNCSSLSRQVEDKFQSYLDSVGAKVSSIQKQSSRLEVQNGELTSELDMCKTDWEKEATESSKKLQDAQQKYDKQLEQLLKEQNRLREAKELVEAKLAVKDATVISLQNGCVQQPKPAGLQPPGTAGLYPPAPGRSH